MSQIILISKQFALAENLIMSFKVLSILALVVLVCVLTATADPAAPEEQATEMAHHHKKSEREWKKHMLRLRDAINATRTHLHHIRKMKEEKESVKDMEKTKRDDEDKVFQFDFGKWLKNFKPAIKEDAPLDIDEKPTTLEAVEATPAAADPAPIPAKEMTNLAGVESVIVEAIDAAPLVLVVEPAVPAPAKEPISLPTVEIVSLTAVEPIVAVEELL